jgi:hypothetical protein
VNEHIAEIDAKGNVTVWEVTAEGAWIKADRSLPVTPGLGRMAPVMATADLLIRGWITTSGWRNLAGIALRASVRESTPDDISMEDD